VNDERSQPDNVLAGADMIHRSRAIEAGAIVQAGQGAPPSRACSISARSARHCLSLPFLIASGSVQIDVVQAAARGHTF